MNNKDFENLTNKFNNYISSYFGRDADTDYYLNLKKEHTFNVLLHAKRISEAFESSSSLHELVPYAALLHDIGRFPQYFNYKTFCDADSEDHGLLSCKIVENEKLLTFSNEDHQKAVLHAILYHNKMEYPVSNYLENTLLNAVRDADKLDIFRVACEHLDPDKTRSLNTHLPDTGIVDPELVKLLLQGKQICYTKRKSYDDMKITMLNWIQDLNFPYSFEHVKTMNYINIISKSIKGKFKYSEVSDYLNGLVERGSKGVVSVL
ncbi:MAG: HD domain-containing protein [Spirochaetes bacterium]|jgi:hypothetical protein|nr:HD domain-containing protein [Spirochaetota bacterium]